MCVCVHLHAGIVYCFSRKDTEAVASGLCEKGMKAAHYHADVAPAQRSKVHLKWLNNTLQVCSEQPLVCPADFMLYKLTPEMRPLAPDSMVPN